MSGNCHTCGAAMHTKHHVTIHPVTKIDDKGNPTRGLEKVVAVCGPCHSSGRDHAVDKFKAGGPGKHALPVTKPAPVAPAPAPSPEPASK
jgi:hypothetical protein